MRAILLCRPSYILVCMALPRRRRCSTMAAASFFTCAGSADSSRALLGADMSVRAAVQQGKLPWFVVPVLVDPNAQIASLSYGSSSSSSSSSQSRCLHTAHRQLAYCYRHKSVVSLREMSRTPAGACVFPRTQGRQSEAWHSDLKVCTYIRPCIQTDNKTDSQKTHQCRPGKVHKAHAHRQHKE